jgi:predicted enzyme related to lactoylglutathione lyase
MSIRYTHTNIIAKDWRSLADFYIRVFGCEFAPPERDLSGAWLDQLVNMDGVKVRGCHLKLPGYDSNGPTLEIFSYDPANHVEEEKLIHRYGLAHLAFHVDDVQAVLEDLEVHGGSAYGELVQEDFPGRGTLTVVYACDPEGNIIEIQNWSK